MNTGRGGKASYITGLSITKVQELCVGDRKLCMLRRYLWPTAAGNRIPAVYPAVSGLVKLSPHIRDPVTQVDRELILTPRYGKFRFPSAAEGGAGVPEPADTAV